MRQYRRLIKNIGIFSIGAIGSKIIQFFLVPLYTNYMQTTEFGIADLVISVGQMLLPILSLTIYDAILPFSGDENDSTQDILVVEIVVFGFSSVMILLFSPLYSFYEPLKKYSWYLSVYIITFFLYEIMSLYLKAIDKNKEYVFYNLIQTLILAILNIILIVEVKMGVEGYLLSIIISNVGFVILAIISSIDSVEFNRIRFNVKLCKRMLKFTVPLIIAAISWRVMNSIDRVIVQRILSDDDLGIYTAASKIPALINVLITIFNQAWLIEVCKENTNDSMFKDVFEVYNILLTIGAIILIGVMQTFMRFYVGVEYYMAWRIVPFLIISAILSAYGVYINNIFYANKNSKSVMISLIIAAIVNIIASVVLTRIIGSIGTALGTMLAFFVHYMLRFIDLRRNYLVDIDIVKVLLTLSILIINACLVIIGYDAILVSAICLLLVLGYNYKKIKNVLCKQY